jgi:hypothetical protein
MPNNKTPHEPESFGETLLGLGGLIIGLFITMGVLDWLGPRSEPVVEAFWSIAGWIPHWLPDWLGELLLVAMIILPIFAASLLISLASTVGIALLAGTLINLLRTNPRLLVILCASLAAAC